MQRIEKLVEIGIALSAEKNTQRLMEMILLGAKQITNADAGTLYSVQPDNTVRMEIIRTSSLNFAMGGTTGTPIPFPPIPLYVGEKPNDRMVVTHAVLNEVTVNIPDAYDAEGFDFSGTRAFDLKTGYRSQSFLTVPMKNHEGDIIGVLQLINAQDDEGNIVPFNAESERLTQALASQAAIALTNKKLINDLEHLFKSFIHVIATAIDEKSPYTGGHCKRVPVLTMLLADAVHHSADGPFKDFVMDEGDRSELEIAAWLHDCGKIITPEYVVDKATKLETKFDRIELVETRFEILRRDIEISMLRAKVAALEAGRPFDREAVEGACRDGKKRLTEQQAFLEHANLGAEFMTEEDQKWVRAIGQQTWVDRHGIRQTLLTEDEAFNLCIQKGTLTPAERQVINNHIVSTIHMLEALPFPKHLKNVPEFAGGHHERVDGNGYPRGLRKEQMSVQARIMAIADVFEALTASDRPYKPGKKLSETLEILGKMAESGHIDPDLYEIFIRERIYLHYAERFLEPDQIDLLDFRPPPPVEEGRAKS